MSEEGAEVVPAVPGVRALTEREFRGLQRLIEDEGGIHLSGAKKALLVGRLARRLRELGLESFGEYLERVRTDADERVRMLDAVSTNETHFFREPQHFQFLAERVFPAWEAEAARGARAKRVRVWSAGCSTGQEPFSLAMVLLERFGPEAGWDVEVLATDLSTRVLERARQATWPVERAAEIPPRLLQRFMLRGTGPQEGRMRAGPPLRAVVRFARVNLVAPALPVGGGFDLVFCRNVLIYFSADTRAKVVRRLLERVGPGGHLLLGHAETLSGLDGVRCVMPTVYAPATEARPRP